MNWMCQEISVVALRYQEASGSLSDSRRVSGGTEGGISGGTEGGIIR